MGYIIDDDYGNILGDELSHHQLWGWKSSHSWMISPQPNPQGDEPPPKSHSPEMGYLRQVFFFSLGNILLGISP